MEEELNFRAEKIRSRIEKIEDEFDKIEEWKKLLDEINEVKLKIFGSGVFSENEEFKDIKTEDIKFLLISFYQAELIQKFNENRDNILLLSLQFYKEFYSILKKYEYLTKERILYYKKITGDFEEDDKEEDRKPTMEELSREREEKIMAFKYKKALSDKLKVKKIKFLEN
jgi:immunoglobulin-binding protein 1